MYPLRVIPQSAGRDLPNYFSETNAVFFIPSQFFNFSMTLTGAHHGL